MEWRRSHKKLNRGVYLIKSRTHLMGRRRLSEIVLGGTHLHQFFFGEVYLHWNGGVHIKSEMKAFICLGVIHIKWVNIPTYRLHFLWTCRCVVGTSCINIVTYSPGVLWTCTLNTGSTIYSQVVLMFGPSVGISSKNLKRPDVS